MEFKNFEKVWQRVTELDTAEFKPPELKADEHEERICLVNHNNKSCAIRFLPKF